MWSSSELLQIFDDYEFKDSDISPTQKSILIAIAKFANNKTGESHPSIERICRITGYKPSGVKKNIKDLHQKLILSVQKRFDPSGDPTSNSYKIDIHRLKGVGHVVHHPGHHVTQVVHQVTEGRSPRDPGVGHHVDPNYKALTNQGTKKRESALSSDQFLPDEQNQFLCKDLGLTLAEELDSFRNRHKGEKSQYEFGRWMKASKEYRSRNQPAQEIRSTVKDWQVVKAETAAWEKQQRALEDMREKLIREGKISA